MAASIRRVADAACSFATVVYPIISPLSAWLTRPNDSLLASLFKLRLIAHYWVGPIAIVAHVACGLRAVLLQRHVSTATANRLALALITLGVVASSLIIAALVNVHIA